MAVRGPYPSRRGRPPAYSAAWRIGLPDLAYDRGPDRSSPPDPGFPMPNELEDEIPPEIEAEAIRLGCAQGVRYVYKDDEYGDEFPAASVGLPAAKRFGSTSYEKCKL